MAASFVASVQSTPAAFAAIRRKIVSAHHRTIGFELCERSFRVINSLSPYRTQPPTTYASYTNTPPMLICSKIIIINIILWHDIYMYGQRLYYDAGREFMQFIFKKSIMKTEWRMCVLVAWFIDFMFAPHEKCLERYAIAWLYNRRP